jgi:hypothetical protein
MMNLPRVLYLIRDFLDDDVSLVIFRLVWKPTGVAPLGKRPDARLDGGLPVPRAISVMLRSAGRWELALPTSTMAPIGACSAAEASGSAT